MRIQEFHLFLVHYFAERIEQIYKNKIISISDSQIIKKLKIKNIIKNNSNQNRTN